jgi:cytochrome c556
MTPKPNPYEVKFSREGAFMPFGSMCNAYGQMNQQKPVDIEKFKSDMIEIYKLAKELVEMSISQTNEKVATENNTDWDNEADLPIIQN